MSSKQPARIMIPSEDEGAYDVIFDEVQFAIKSLTAMTEAQLEEIGRHVIEETDCLGSGCCDRFERVATELHQRAKSKGRKKTFLGGFTLPQQFLGLAWVENVRAAYCLNSWVHDPLEDDTLLGVDSAMMVAQALSHAKALLASGPSKTGQKVTRRPPRAR